MSGLPATVESPSRPSRQTTVSTRLFVPSRRWIVVSYWAVFAVLLLAPTYLRDSAWIAVAIGAAIVVLWHGIHAARVVPWIPGLIAITCIVQWLLAAWVAYHFFEGIPSLQMQVDAKTYFGYAAPATAALILGLYLPLWRLGTTPKSGTAVPILLSDVRRVCDLLLIGGLVTRLLVTPVAPMSVRFLFQLFGLLSYVGVFTMLLANAPGWRWRLALVLAIEAFIDSFWGQYLELFSWLCFAGLLYVFRFRVSVRRSLALGCLGLAFIFVVNLMKGQLRSQVQESDYGAAQRAQIAAEYTTDLLSQPGELLSMANALKNLGRLNQGVVISRIMSWTPLREPFAEGETVLTAVRAALLPRILDPDKYVAGVMNYTRFTGYDLINGTSINLSAAGEMYANFGIAGGWLACFFYGLFMGGVYRAFVVLARRSHLWWAWAPYVMFTMPVAETGLGEMLNQFTKSVIVMAMVVFLFPEWRRLWRRRSVARAPKHGALVPAMPAARGGD